MQKDHQITKNKVFNFDNYSPIVSESVSATVRSSIQLEKQQEQLSQQHQKLSSPHYPLHSYQHNIAMPTLLPSNPPTMPVMISSKVSPSTTSNAFSISELMRKDKLPTDQSQPPPQQMVTNSIVSSQGVTVLKQQNINININDGRQSVLLFGSSQSQPPSLIRHPSEPNKSGQGLLLIPAASANGNFHMPSSQPIHTESAFSKYQPISSQLGNCVDEPWNSLRMSGTTNSVTGARSSSAARIRFDDSKTEVLTDRPVKSEPTTPTPGSPWKKSILKRQSNDGMEK